VAPYPSQSPRTVTAQPGSQALTEVIPVITLQLCQLPETLTDGVFGSELLSSASGVVYRLVSGAPQSVDSG